VESDPLARGTCIARMRIARRRAATRNLVAALLGAFLLGPLPVWAEGGQNLILPLVTAIAVASAASKVPMEVATIEPGHRPLLSLIPNRVHFEDGYQIDVVDYIGRRSPVALINSDRIVAYEVLPGRSSSFMRASAAIDVPMPQPGAVSVILTSTRRPSPSGETRMSYTSPRSTMFTGISGS
jgi:hypothetical protein